MNEGQRAYLFEGEHGVCHVDQPHGHIDVDGFFIDDGRLFTFEKAKPSPSGWVMGGDPHEQ